MKKPTPLVLGAMLAAVCVLGAFAVPEPGPTTEPEIGSTAPDFTLVASDGETYTLSDLRGKYVVLEWLNFGCPYVQRHYQSGNMPGLQEKYTEQGVVWLSVVSSAPGKQGYYPPAQMEVQREKHGGQQTAILLDPEGTVGRAYGAQTTPHMYVISPEGTLLYKGGIDDKPRASPSETRNVPSYVSAALDASMEGQPVAVTSARPYGCGVKY